LLKKNNLHVAYRLRAYAVQLAHHQRIEKKGEKALGYLPQCGNGRNYTMTENLVSYV